MTATSWRSSVAYHLNDPAVIADPYPIYARLRDEAPVAYVEDVDLWVLSRYDDVLAALRDPEMFSSDLRGLAKGLRVNPFNPTMKIPRRLAAIGGRLPWARVLLTSDPPEHTVLRRKISKAFTPRMSSRATDSAIGSARVDAGSRVEQGAKPPFPFSRLEPPCCGEPGIPSRLKIQVSISLEAPLIFVEQAHAFGWLHLI